MIESRKIKREGQHLAGGQARFKRKRTIGSPLARRERNAGDLSQQAVAALFVANDPYLDSQRDQIIALAARAAIPAMYYTRSHTAAGGLISYGANIAEAYRQAGIYRADTQGGKTGRPAGHPAHQITLMRNGRDRRSENPQRVTRGKNAWF